MIVGAGKPVAVIVKVLNAPAVKVALLMLVTAAAWSTTIVKVCFAAFPTPLEAVMVMGQLPLAFAVGVPAIRPVAGLASTPDGSAPVMLRVGCGYPLVVM